MPSYSRYGRPALKNSVDVQLQTAFSDGNWPSVIRLADKRAKSLKDPYYEAIKIAAESQLDSAAEQCAVLVAIDELIRQKTVPDLDTIDLYEWATQDLLADLEYAETLGPLRARWVKANPKSPLAVQCLQSCLEYWDLVSAQQIAATLDKTYLNSGDRRYMFWSIILTFLLSISPQCTEASRKVYSMLVLRQLERAADTTESSEKLSSTDRGLLTEEECYLYYRVLLKHGTRDDFVSRMQSQRLGALAQLKEKRKPLFWEALDAFESWGEWDRIYDLCNQALSLSADGGKPSFFACDWQVWKRFAVAASKATDQEAALGQVQDVLKKFTAETASTNAMYKKNIRLALVETTFQLPPVLLNANPDHGGMTPRVVQLGLFLEQYFDRLAAFDDIKGYVAQLSFEEAKCFLEKVLPNILGEDTDPIRQIILKSLECKLRYLLTTCPQTLSHYPSVVDGKEQDKDYRCRFCSNLTNLPCEHCLKKIIAAAADVYKQVATDKKLIEAIPKLDKDPRIDLAIVMALSLLKLSGLRQTLSDVPAASALRDVNPSLFLQAVALLDMQLRETPGDTGLRLLLVQLHLLLGCASYAHQLWIPMDVKRTIQDALSPLFFDRISSISPGLFQGSRPLMEPLRSYYSNCMRDNSPLRIWDAFSSGSYSSILDMAEYDSRLRRSCTLMMTLVEERRATRSFGGKIECDIEDHVLVSHITGDTTLVNATDYGSFPNLESHHGAPVQDLVRFGPAISNERSHLAFLSEQYLDLILFKYPKDYKLSRANEVAIKDRNYVMETLSHISSSLTDFIHSSKTPQGLTGPEMTYYTVLSLLSAGLLTALTTSRADPLPKTFSLLTSSIKSAFGGLRTTFLTPIPSSSPLSPQSEAFYALTDMHTMSYVRDTALAIRHSAAFVIAFHEKELARDRSGRSSLHKDVIAEMKALDGVASKALGEVKARIQRLKEQLGEGGWLDRMLEWTFGREEDEVSKAVSQVVPTEAVEEWIGKVLESWREGVKGWGMVRME
ncbi:N-acetyltransferase B complex non catalytic subunit-domain-containing protein [Diplogelasinospora grovesii]|uniref:N-acetyltransferase B complex non catalytic subunit-domain-containing protein n=1 Tax=Diplogelasinospora grovesii TaxID=303347 RepID=A0AAN6N850_9PEZI|nr:N-acetyltransferase B complex non catalytic subunit-domain-containing protein [Diplogelasinospora grovesii]